MTRKHVSCIPASFSRRNFLKGLEISLGTAAALSAQKAPAQSPVSRHLSGSAAPPLPGKGITNNLRSPYMKLRSVDVNSVRWTSGLWAERFDICARATVQHVWQEMENIHYANFLRAVGDKEGMQFSGSGFADGDLYKWLEGAIAAYNVTRDPKLGALIDKVTSVIARAQQSDGYLFTRLTLDQRRGRAGARPFERAIDFETYNCGHLMTAACLHYKTTGEQSLLNVAVKLSDFLCVAFASPTPDLARFDICPSHYMGIIEMYRTTGDPRYLDLGKKFIDMRDLVENGTDQNQERIPFRQQTKAVGHAVRANYLYAGVADVYAETGDQTLLTPLKAIWEDMVSHKLYITGATGALNSGTSPSTYGRGYVQELTAKGDYAAAQAEKEGALEAIHFVSQAYGREYELPNLTSYNESCATIGSVLWNWRMLQITGEPKYADLLETTLLNGILSAVSLDGSRYFYANALKRSKDTPFPMRYPPGRQEHFRSFCCPPNIERTLAETHCYAYCVSGDAVWTVLYGANKWSGALGNGTGVVLTQQTDYPWSGAVKILVETKDPAEFALMLRIPPWAKDASVLVRSGGSKQWEKPRLEPGQFFELRRKWSSGDEVELSLPMKVRLVEGHHLVEETRGQVAVLRGPVVYCLESPDIEPGVQLSDLAVPRNVQFRSVQQTIVGVQVPALEGEILQYEHRDWGNDLYRDVSSAAPRRVKVRMIPYFSWDNRGLTEMSIWLPLG
jgi:DUF1680 family protein